MPPRSSGRTGGKERGVQKNEVNISLSHLSQIVLYRGLFTSNNYCSALAIYYYIDLLLKNSPINRSDNYQKHSRIFSLINKFTLSYACNIIFKRFTSCMFHCRFQCFVNQNIFCLQCCCLFVFFRLLSLTQILHYQCFFSLTISLLNMLFTAFIFQHFPPLYSFPFETSFIQRKSNDKQHFFAKQFIFLQRRSMIEGIG